MKKLSKKEQNLNLLIIVIAIALAGASIVYYLRNKMPKNNSGASDNITDFIPVKQEATVFEETPQSTNFKEVTNAWFTDNPFAFSGVENLNIRNVPGQKSKVIKQVGKDEYIGRHTGKSTDIGWPSDPGRWAKITLTDGQTGWVFSGLITSKKTRSLNGIEGFTTMKVLA